MKRKFFIIILIIAFIALLAGGGILVRKMVIQRQEYIDELMQMELPDVVFSHRYEDDGRKPHYYNFWNWWICRIIGRLRNMRMYQLMRCWIYIGRGFIWRTGNEFLFNILFFLQMQSTLLSMNAELNWLNG